MLNQSVINFAKQTWNISENVIFIRHVANYIYHAPKSKLFIRITHGSHRSQREIESELHWMDYLSQNNIHFAHPVTSLNQKLIEVISYNENHFIISVFKEAPGIKAIKKEQFSDQLFFNWGETLGKLHKYTKDYVCPEHIQKRKQWDTDEYHLNIKKYTNKEDAHIYERFIEIVDKISLLPKNKDNFGLIHADFHTGNFHIDDDYKITLFDFDDCVYHWFAYDIATIFWSIENHDLDWSKCESSFFKGYHLQNRLPKISYDSLSLFYEYRILLINAFCKQSLSTDKLDAKASKWMKATITKTENYFSHNNNCPFFKTV